MTQSDEKRIEELISQHLQERETSWTAMDELDWLHHNRIKAEKRLKASQQRLTRTFNHLRSKEVPTSLWGQGLYWAERGLTVAKGARIGYQIGNAISLIMGIKKMMKKK